MLLYCNTLILKMLSLYFSMFVNEKPDSSSEWIFQLIDCFFFLSGKCNNIILDSCKKTAVVFESVVSSCEFINCQSVQMQVGHAVSTIVKDINICGLDLCKPNQPNLFLSVKYFDELTRLFDRDNFCKPLKMQVFYFGFLRNCQKIVNAFVLEGFLKCWVGQRYLMPTRALVNRYRYLSLTCVFLHSFSLIKKNLNNEKFFFLVGAGVSADHFY